MRHRNQEGGASQESQEPFHPDEIAIPTPSLPELELTEAGIHLLISQASARKIPILNDALVKTALAAFAYKSAHADERATRLWAVAAYEKMVEQVKSLEAANRRLREAALAQCEEIAMEHHEYEVADSIRALRDLSLDPNATIG